MLFGQDFESASDEPLAEISFDLRCIFHFFEMQNELTSPNPPFVAHLPTVILDIFSLQADNEQEKAASEHVTCLESTSRKPTCKSFRSTAPTWTYAS